MAEEEYLSGTVQTTKLKGYVKFRLNKEFTFNYNGEACSVRDIYLSLESVKRYVSGENKINRSYVKGRALGNAGYVSNGSGGLVKKIVHRTAVKQSAENKGDENIVTDVELDRLMAESNLENLTSKSGSGDAILE